MNDIIKSVLDKIESNGYEAYIVGGYVRDYLLGVQSTDVDICTNALPKDLANIFKIKTDSLNLGSISFKINMYNFDITTYRSESNYVNRKPEKVIYSNNLLVDIKRRDFTINTICMSSSGKILDFYNAKDDIKNRVIRVIGDIEKKFNEDPLRLLRAIRFAIILDFELDKSILEYLSMNKKVLKTLSYTRKKNELDKIFTSKNAAKGLSLLKKLDLLDSLDIFYDNVLIVNDINGIWSQIEFDNKYPFTKTSLKNIEIIRKIVSNGFISNRDLFDYDLYIIMIAGEILNVTKDKIINLKNNLIIKDKSELKFTPLNIIDTLQIKNSPNISLIYNDIINKVLDLSLSNNYNEIKDYIIKNWK